MVEKAAGKDVGGRLWFILCFSSGNLQHEVASPLWFVDVPEWVPKTDVLVLLLDLSFANLLGALYMSPLVPKLAPQSRVR